VDVAREGGRDPTLLLRWGGGVQRKEGGLEGGRHAIITEQPRESGGKVLQARGKYKGDWYWKIDDS